jgi:hypothetical protein
VQLDRVRRDTILAVVEVEERDARNSRVGTRPCCSPRSRHEPTVVQRRSVVAVLGWRLTDHVGTVLLQDEVIVGVRLFAHKRHSRDDREDAMLEREARRREVRRRWPRHEVPHFRQPVREQARPVLQRLDRPTVDAAAVAGARVAPVRPESRRDGEGGGQKNDE